MSVLACSVTGCDRTGKIRRTYCENHYRKFLRHGTPTPQPRVTHGTASQYRYGCRCSPCTTAHAEKYREWSRAYFEKTGEWNGGRWIKAEARQAIYERDEWTCLICHHPVERDGDPNGPWAASLDHIVPKSSTSEPDHSPANLRTAHRWCNALRGDARMTDEEVRSLKTATLEVSTACG